MNEDTVEILRMAGWYEGRQLSEAVVHWEAELSATGSFVTNNAARRFLIEFGGLAWPPQDTEGHLAGCSFNIDPLAAAFQDDRFAVATEDADVPLFPVGEAYNGNYFLAVAPNGDIYLVMDDVERFGSDAWAAFDRLLLGR